GTIQFVNDPELIVNGTLVLNGGGLFAMTDSTGSTVNTLNQIVAAQPGAILSNVDNTITGGNATIGHLGDGALTLQNFGIIDATPLITETPTPPVTTSDGIIVLNTGKTIQNAGLLEATNGGELDVKDSAIQNTGTGTKGILIDNTSTLLVDVGVLQLTGGGKFALSGGTITGPGNELENVSNTIVGTGTISNLTLVNDVAGTIDAGG